MSPTPSSRPLPPPPASKLRRSAAVVAACLFLVGLWACDPGFPSSEGAARIDEATFIDTYVELRLAALEHGELPVSERERILAEHRVTEDDLREFIEVHGRNVPYMSGVWSEVDHRIAEALADDAGAGEDEEAAPGG